MFKDLRCLKDNVYDMDLMPNLDLKIHLPRKVPYAIKQEIKKRTG